MLCCVAGSRIKTHWAQLIIKLADPVFHDDITTSSYLDRRRSGCQGTRVWL